MNKLALLFVLGAMLTAPAAGQFVYVDDNNPATGVSNDYPFNFSTATGRHMQILPAKALAVIKGPYKITEIAFSRSSGFPTSFSAKQFQMRMAHTTRFCPISSVFADNFDSIPIHLIDKGSGFTYAVPKRDVWTDIGTVTDFAWDGQHNVCLEIRYRGQATTLGFACHTSATTPRVWSAKTSISDNFAASTGTTECAKGLKVRLTVDRRCVNQVPNFVTLGTTLAIALSTLPPQVSYQIGASLGQGPLKLTSRFTMGLDLDSLLIASVKVGPPVFKDFAGSTGTSGTAIGRLAVPTLTALVGVRVYTAALMFDHIGMICTTNTGGTEIRAK